MCAGNLWSLSRHPIVKKIESRRDYALESKEWFPTKALSPGFRLNLLSAAMMPFNKFPRTRYMRNRSQCMAVVTSAGFIWDSHPNDGYGLYLRRIDLGAFLKIARGPAERDFGVCQGGESPSWTGHRASPQWAVRTEPTPADDKSPDALRVFAVKVAWLRCSSLEDPRGIFSFVAPPSSVAGLLRRTGCHPAFSPETGSLGIFRQAPSRKHADGSHE